MSVSESVCMRNQFGVFALASIAGEQLERIDVDLEDAAIRARIDRDAVSGEQSGVDGTPSLFIDGRRYGGPRDVVSLAAALGLPSQDLAGS